MHELEPAFSRIAVTPEEARFVPSGAEYTRPDLINQGFNNGIFLHYPDEPRSASAGERLPIPQFPAGLPFKPGQESPYAGKAEFYTLRYGPYLIGMNTTPDRSFDLAVPATGHPVEELVSGRNGLHQAAKEIIGPRSTVVFYLGEGAATAP